MPSCTRCPRGCADRFCGRGDTLKIARAALHFWEEPCLSGERGSGTIFFSGCPLRCVYCQNQEISHHGFGKEVSVERLAEIMWELQEKGAHNINLVSPTPYAPLLVEAVRAARSRGVLVPVVYNTSGYETVEAIHALQGTVDIYLTDFKYMDDTYARAYSGVDHYAATAKAALDAMVEQTGESRWDAQGMLQKGVMVRHLMLPGLFADTKAVLAYVFGRYGNQVTISLMNQYTPCGDLHAYPALQKKLSQKAYRAAVAYALSLGVQNAYVQEGGTAQESFIPPFDLEGVEKSTIK